MNLSKRLDFIYQFIKKKNFQTIYDVGSDHGKLMIKLREDDDTKELWATDISKKAMMELQKKIEKHHLTINCLVADGLTKIKKATDLVIIAGLGQQKIHDILNDDCSLIANYAIQSQDNPTVIREWIKKNEFFLSDEKLIQEKKHYYHYLFINKKSGTKIKKKEDITFGPILLKEKDDAFIQFWKKQKAMMTKIIKKTTDWQKKERINQQMIFMKQLLGI